MKQEHEGKIAVITGGGRGFGKAFGQALAQRGAKVLLVDLDIAAARLAATEIGTNAQAAIGDVADEAAMQALMARIGALHGGIDILINNAAIHSAQANQYIGKLGTAQTRRMFDVNVWGVVHCTLAAQPFMVGRKGAAIVNISSTAAYASQTAYGVTKLAVRGLTVSFAHEFGPNGIRVNAIAPGLVLTDTNRAELSAEVIRQYQSLQIIDRAGEEIDIVASMLWLVSEQASFVTGETIRVSGGATLSI